MAPRDFIQKNKRTGTQSEPPVSERSALRSVPEDFPTFEAVLRENIPVYQPDSDEEGTLLQLFTDALLQARYSTRIATGIYNQELFQYLENTDMEDNDQNFEQALAACEAKCRSNSTYVSAQQRAKTGVRLMKLLQARLALVQKQRKAATTQSTLTPDGIRVISDTGADDPQVQKLLKRMRQMDSEIRKHNKKVN